MEQRVLEIKLMSARDLNKVNLINKMDIYAVVYISGDGNSKQKVKSPVDRDGDSNPTWDFPMKFTVDVTAAHQNRLTLVFNLRCERALGDKDVGEVHVPVKELFQSAEDLEGKQQFVSYQVRKPSGKPKGELTFGYKFGEKIEAKGEYNHHPGPAKFGEKIEAKGEYNHHPGSAMAYPAPNSHTAGPSSLYPPPQGHGPTYPPPAEGGYYNQSHPPPPPPHVVAPPSAGYPYPPPPQPTGYGYPPPPPYNGYPPQPAPGYGYPPQPGYGYPHTMQQQQPPKKNNKFGLGLGAGLLGGALGGMLIGDMVSDAGAYDAGYDDGFDAGLDF